MASYLVNTPGNPNFSGKLYGIPFTNGRAFVSEQTVDRRLGWTPEQIAFSMKNDFGYDVLELAAPANAPVLPPEYFGNIPPEVVKAELESGAPVLKEQPVESPAFAEASPAPADEPAPASTKEKRSRRRKGAEESDSAEG